MTELHNVYEQARNHGISAAALTAGLLALHAEHTTTLPPPNIAELGNKALQRIADYRQITIVAPLAQEAI